MNPAAPNPPTSFTLCLVSILLAWAAIWAILTWIAPPVFQNP